jgi:hypothetical protein
MINFSAVALPALVISKSRWCFVGGCCGGSGLNSSSSSDSIACLGGPTSANGSVSWPEGSQPRVTHAVVISYHDDMGVTVGTRSLHGMIRLFVARLRPQCVSPSLKTLPVLCCRHRGVHTGGAEYDTEVENTPLLRIVRNRASECSNLRSEVSYNRDIDLDLR